MKPVPPVTAASGAAEPAGVSGGDRFVEVVMA